MVVAGVESAHPSMSTVIATAEIMYPQAFHSTLHLYLCFGWCTRICYLSFSLYFYLFIKENL
jgi:hypothetical protein